MVITKTPFRISFFGGGTDYPVWYEQNGGAVLSTTIDKYCYVTCRQYPPFFEDKVRMVWSKIELVQNASELQHPTAREILKFFNVHKNIEIHHAADLPARSGLGASSSFVVGLLHGMYALLGKPVTKDQLAREAIHIERDRAQERVGSQDQIAAAHGGFNKIIFHPDGKFEVVPVRVRPHVLADLENRLLLFFTGVSRNTSDVTKSQIANTPNKTKELTEMHKMVDRGIALLESGRLDDFGRLLHESWQLKRQLSNQISNPQIDTIYETARQGGALGGKLLGAGSGGFMLIYADPKDHEIIKKKLSNYLCVPFRFDTSGTQIIHQSSELKLENNE